MRTILIVDDDHAVRGLLRRLITDMGHRVEEADGALAALEVLARVPVDLALCDIIMPEYDGVWLTERILERHPDVKVALVTGLMEMDPTVSLRPGVVGYLVKPVMRAALVTLLREAFELQPDIRSAALDFIAVDAL